MCTVLVGEEWSGEGRLLEVMNPYATPSASPILVRELSSIPNVAHEGLRFSRDGKTLYFVDEWNSGSIYKFVLKKAGDLSRGQSFVLKVDAFAGDPKADYNQQPAGTVRTGAATWVPITNPEGVKLTTVDPYRNGPTDDPRTSQITRGGRPAADEVMGTPYGRPEDMEISKLASGNEVLYFTATSENAIYSVEMLANNKATVRLFASESATQKNVGFAATTATLNSPDNLAQDGAGNIYVIEDAPNGSSTGGDIWFVRDVNNDGVAESLDHFLSIRVAGSEATGMIFDVNDPMIFAVAVQHPDTTDLTAHPNGMGDALWAFNISGTAPVCGAGSPNNCASRPNQIVADIRRLGNEARKAERDVRNKCTRLMRQQMNLE
jgi:secreted PhoX family phosphatase